VRLYLWGNAEGQASSNNDCSEDDVKKSIQDAVSSILTAEFRVSVSNLIIFVMIVIPIVAWQTVHIG
jgi:hypothetical protein